MSQGYGPPGDPGQPPYPYSPQPPYPYPYPYRGGYPPAPPAGPTSEERSMAMLAHVLSIFSTFVAPLVIYYVKRKESPFVAFHAMQALIWHVLFMVGCFLSFIVIFFMMGFAERLASPALTRGHDPPSPQVFVGFFAVWAVMMLTWFANLGCTVYMTIRASNGQWSGYPIVGALVRRFGGYERSR